MVGAACYWGGLTVTESGLEGWGGERLRALFSAAEASSGRRNGETFSGSKQASTRETPKTRASERTGKGAAVQSQKSGVEGVFSGRWGRGKSAANISALCAALVETPVPGGAWLACVRPREGAHAAGWSLRGHGQCGRGQRVQLAEAAVHLPRVPRA